MIKGKRKSYSSRLLVHTNASLLAQIFSTLILYKIASCSNIQNNTSYDLDLLNQASDENHVKFNEISTSHNKCIKAEDDLDACSARLIAIGQSKVNYPDNMEQLNSVYCPNFKKIVDCIKTSSSCYKPFEKQIINWILSSTRRINYKRCRNEDEKVRFLRLTNSCFSLMKNTMDKCMFNYRVQLEAIADLDKKIERLTEEDIQIQLSCCANIRFKECVMKNAKQNCRPVDSLKKLRRTNSVSSQRVAHKRIQRAMVDMMDDLKSTLNGMALTGPELICQGVDEKFCKTNFDGKFNSKFPRYKSIIPAMIQIYSNK